MAVIALLLAPQAAEAKGHRPYTAAPAKEGEVPQVRLDDWRTLNYDSIRLRPGIMFMPLIFNQLHQFTADSVAAPAAQPKRHEPLNGHSQWLDSVAASRTADARTRYEVMISHPQLVHYNTATLPEPPKEYVVEADPSRNKLTVDPFVPTEAKPERPVDRRQLRRRNWLHTLTSSLHFTQAYISSNWYQGGENNVNVLGDIEWQFNLNQNLHPNILFSNTMRYKVGVMTAHSDTLRNYSLNEDNFQFNSKFGYKAIKNWYYSATLQFKTQFFNNYKANSHTMSAAFLSPGEVNVGLGMTYNYNDPNRDRSVSLSVAPASYNLKICRNITDLKPTSFGIDAGHHTKHNVGSNLECKFVWRFNASIGWTSRLYAFTNYEYVQGDFENTFDFYITRHLQTRLYVHLRYDKSRARDDDWRYWQLKEILSLGLTYRFATN